MLEGGILEVLCVCVLIGVGEIIGRMKANNYLCQETDHKVLNEVFMRCN